MMSIDEQPPLLTTPLPQQPPPPLPLLAGGPKPKRSANSGGLPPKRRRKNADGESNALGAAVAGGGGGGPRKQVGQKGWIWPFWTPLVDTKPGYSRCKFCQGELSHCNPTRLKDHLLKKCKEFLTHEDALRLAETEMEVKDAMLRADSQGRLSSCSGAVSPRSKREKKKEAAPTLEYIDGLGAEQQLQLQVQAQQQLQLQQVPADAFHEHLNSVEQSGKRLVQLIERARHMALERDESEKAKVEASAAADLAALHAKIAKGATAYAKLMQSHHELEQQLFAEREENRRLDRDLQDMRARVTMLQEEKAAMDVPLPGDDAPRLCSRCELPIPNE